MSHAPTIKGIRLHESSAGRRFDCIMPLSGRWLMALGRPIVAGGLVILRRSVVLRRLIVVGRLVTLRRFSAVGVIAAGTGRVTAASAGTSAAAEPRPQGPTFSGRP